MSRIESSGAVVSDSLFHACKLVLTPSTSTNLDMIASSMSQAHLRSQVTNLGLRMTSFLAEVHRLQQIVCICSKVQVIVNTGVLAGLRVAEEVREH